MRGHGETGTVNCVPGANRGSSAHLSQRERWAEHVARAGAVYAQNLKPRALAPPLASARDLDGGLDRQRAATDADFAYRIGHLDALAPEGVPQRQHHLA